VTAVFSVRIASKGPIYALDGRNPGAARAMLCFPQMATKAQITAERYLHMTFEHDAEFVHGEIVERSLPDNVHSLIQFLIEILSKDDRHRDLMMKLEEYRVWGVPNIWIVNPVAKRFVIYSEWGLQNVTSLTLADYPFELTPSVLFSDL
jgi:Uma2 family endonuclease